MPNHCKDGPHQAVANGRKGASKVASKVRREQAVVAHERFVRVARQTQRAFAAPLPVVEITGKDYR